MVLGFCLRTWRVFCFRLAGQLRKFLRVWRRTESSCQAESPVLKGLRASAQVCAGGAQLPAQFFVNWLTLCFFLVSASVSSLCVN
jgi:hypothetical protein